MCEEMINLLKKIVSIKLLIQNVCDGNSVLPIEGEVSIQIQREFFSGLEEKIVTQVKRELTSELKDDGQWLQCQKDEILKDMPSGIFL